VGREEKREASAGMVRAAVKEGALAAPLPRTSPAVLAPSTRGEARLLPRGRLCAQGGRGGEGREAEGAGLGGTPGTGRGGPPALACRGRRERVVMEAVTTCRSPNTPSPSMDTHRVSRGAASSVAPRLCEAGARANRLPKRSRTYACGSSCETREAARGEGPGGCSHLSACGGCRVARG
jgi:hypothetical protein